MLFRSRLSSRCSIVAIFFSPHWPLASFFALARWPVLCWCMPFFTSQRSTISNWIYNIIIQTNEPALFSILSNFSIVYSFERHVYVSHLPECIERVSPCVRSLYNQNWNCYDYASPVCSADRVNSRLFLLRQTCFVYGMNAHQEFSSCNHQSV